jgi:hypothetical protein
VLLKKVKVILILIALSLSSVTVAGTLVKDISISGAVQQNTLPVDPLNGSFEFLSGFTQSNNYTDYGWSLVSGEPTPLISSFPNYFGEPSIALANGTTLFSDKSVVKGDKAVSFQFVINANDGNGSFAISNSTGASIAAVSVDGTNVSISSGNGSSSFSGEISPTSEISNGWVLVSGNLFNYTEGNTSGWRLLLFLDNTSSVFANISAPLGYSYGGVEISSSSGDVYFTDIIFTSYRMALFIPGYNNMEGYGQGSGALVSLLQPFTILHSNFMLYNWSVARYSTLSFQINVMNLTGAESPTSNGFFQLGVDLDPNGKIAPWYVTGKSAIAIYFNNHPSPDYMPGFDTPNGTLLGLTIQYIPLEEKIIFQIVDYSVNNQFRFWNTSIQYNGPEFCAAYTQIETSSMNGSQLNNYRFNGTMYNISYGSDMSSMTLLNSSYMLPFSIDAPLNWSLTYYSDVTAGYRQMD